jgi:tRNA nucleotidyltransferase/poly(A) polymerase
LLFWVKKQDRKGRPYAFGLKVRGDEFDLSVFTKQIRGPEGVILEPGTHADDAAGRDFTINAMSLLLANDNGPNKELYDFYGGMHHLLGRKIAAVGNLEQKLKEDPVRALRYARMLSRYGDPKKISEEERAVLRAAAEQMAQINPEAIQGEFLKGLDHDDQDSRQYLRIFNYLGLLPGIFPGIQLDTNLPKQLRELGDKHAPLAWMMRSYDPEQLEQMLMRQRWRPEDTKKIVFLVKALHKLDDNIDQAGLDDLVQSYLKSGLSARKLKMWATKMGGKHEALIDAFLQHAASPRVKVISDTPEGSQPTDAFADLQDPFSGQMNNEEVEIRRNQMEWENFRAILNYHRPKRT